MIEFDCIVCGKHVKKAWSNKDTRVPKFCSRACKAQKQREAKPVSKDWLHQKYVVEGLDTSQIGLLVGRDPKRVWDWLKDFGIQTRGRGYASSQYAFKKGQKSLFSGNKHTEENKEKFRKLRLSDGHVPYLKNGVHHLKGKRGIETPNWKGGVTAERQAVYGSLEWKAAAKNVWARDRGICQKCGKKYCKSERGKFDIHHIDGFSNVALRCETSNLVLLCEDCHYWVHSNANTSKEFLK